MLGVNVNDRLIKISDDQLSKEKIESIKIIIDKYDITEILDFKFTFKETLFELMGNSTEVTLNKSFSIKEFLELLTELFINMEKESDDLENVTISFEGLFII